MQPFVVLGRGWLGRAAIEAGRLAGIPVESIDRSTRPDVFPPSPILALRSVVEPASVVINACGSMLGDEEELMESNYRLARFVARAVAPTGARLVHVGSAAEYGPQTSYLVHESDVPDPRSAYGRTKLAGSETVLETCEPGQVVVARVFNPVGPGQPPHLPASEFARTARAAVSGPVVVRNADTERDFVSIRDVGSALIGLATTAHLDDSVVNVCSGVGLRYGELVQAMLQELGSERAVRSLDEPGLQRVVGDPSRLARMTGLKLSASPAMMADLALRAV